ncbi:hypothetical protein PLICRDRAFT_173151 [Plicaturopsis crispa FD-325 SS-3]|nr:hypothetical protein PLICRDRAFT_173151 [Plicaturopsis crispa FD-325 SS-3]
MDPSSAGHQPFRLGQSFPYPSDSCGSHTGLRTGPRAGAHTTIIYDQYTGRGYPAADLGLPGDMSFDFAAGAVYAKMDSYWIRWQGPMAEGPASEMSHPWFPDRVLWIGDTLASWVDRKIFYDCRCEAQRCGDDLRISAILDRLHEAEAFRYPPLKRPHAVNAAEPNKRRRLESTSASSAIVDYDSSTDVGNSPGSHSSTSPPRRHSVGDSSITSRQKPSANPFKSAVAKRVEPAHESFGPSKNIFITDKTPDCLNSSTFRVVSTGSPAQDNGLRESNSKTPNFVDAGVQRDSSSVLEDLSGDSFRPSLVPVPWEEYAFASTASRAIVKGRRKRATRVQRTSEREELSAEWFHGEIQRVNQHLQVKEDPDVNTAPGPTTYLFPNVFPNTLANQFAQAIWASIPGPMSSRIGIEPHGAETHPKPVVVFIPGAWHTINAFANVRAHLEARGYPSEVLSLPSMRAERPKGSLHDIAYTQVALEHLVDEGREVILAVHASQGQTAGCAIENLGIVSRTKAGKCGGVITFVYMGSFLTPPGKSVRGMLGEWLPWVKAGGDCYRLSHDTSTSTDAEHLNACNGFFTAPVTDEPWHPIPSMHMFSASEYQEQENMPTAFWTHSTVESRRSPFLSDPEKVVHAIEVANNLGQSAKIAARYL